MSSRRGNGLKEKASAELTNVMPAINRPPLSLPGVQTDDPARSRPSRGRSGTAEHKTAAGPSRRGGRTGDHQVRPSERHGA